MKNILKTILGIIITFIIGFLLGFFPLYEQNTDTQNFINTQNTTLFIQTDDSADLLRATEAEIIVENEDKKKKTEIQENNNFQKIEIGNKTTISFSSKTGLEKTYAHILFPDGQILTIHPQTAVSISPSQTGYNIDLLQGNINPEKEKTSYITKSYEQKKEEYFIQLIGGEKMLNKSYDAFIGRYLNIMYSVSPSKYAQNLINYNEFHNILPYEKQSNFETNTKLNSKILNKTSDGFQSTKIKARRNTIEKFFTPKQ